jgi:catechol 2,3-dioxygenase-like lactoylglutathione lyase family enzyme
MRVQLALNVRNLDEAIDYYGKLFGARPNKRKPGYANFAIDQPPLKLVLLEVPDAPERLNHLGVEVFEQSDVDAAIARLSAAGIAGKIEVDSTCCHAVQNKVWSSDPQGARWEFYRVLADSDAFAAPPPAAPVAPTAAGACGCA